MTTSILETNDPDVPKLRKMLTTLQQSVKAGELTPRAANQALGNYADNLIAVRTRPEGARRLAMVGRWA